MFALTVVSVVNIVQYDWQKWWRKHVCWYCSILNDAWKRLGSFKLNMEGSNVQVLLQKYGNPLHPNISMKILHIVLLPFLVVLLRRNFLMITSFISWLVTLMFHLVLDSSHSWGWKDWSVSSKLEFATDFAVVIGQNGQQNGVKNMGHYPYFCGTTQYVICLIFTNPILKKIGLCFSNLYLWYPSLFNIRFFSPHKWSCDSP